MTSPWVTARDFYGSLTLIWLFLVMVSIQSTGGGVGWKGYVLPIGALVILAMYAREWRRHNAPKTGQ